MLLLLDLLEHFKSFLIAANQDSIETQDSVMNLMSCICGDDQS
jgi:hypothetical protein